MNIQVTPQPAVAARLFKEAMSRVTGAVHIVTTDGPAGKAGFTATAVCSVTADPPTLLVCVNETSSVGQTFMANQALASNTIGSEFNDLAMLMGGKTPLEDRFAAAQWTPGSQGAPMLEGAMVAFDCVTESSHVVGTHRVLFCRVVDVRLGAAATDPSLYLGRGFRRLAPV
jgi:flavin reductase